MLLFIASLYSQTKPRSKAVFLKLTAEYIVIFCNVFHKIITLSDDPKKMLTFAYKMQIIIRLSE